MQKDAIEIVSPPAPGSFQVVEFQRDVELGDPVLVVNCPLMDGRSRRFLLPFNLAGHAKSVISYLERQDAVVLLDPREIQNALDKARTDKGLLASVAHRTGWVGRNFVFEDKFIGPTKRAVKFVDGDGAESNLHNRAPLKVWKAAFRPLIRRSTTLVTFIGAAFAAPLLGFLERDGLPLLHVVGGTAKERELAVRTALAATNTADLKDLLPHVHPLRAHKDALKIRHDQLAVFISRRGEDALRRRKSREATAGCVFTGSFSPSVRENRDLRLIALSVDLDDDEPIADVRKPAICIVPLHGEQGLLDGEDATNHKTFPTDLEAAINEASGGALPAFIRKLRKDEHATEKILRYERRFAEKARAKPGTQPPSSVEAFGLIYAAARLAFDYGVAPWEEGDAFRSVMAAFRRSVEVASPINEIADQALRKLAEQCSSGDLFPTVERGQSVPKGLKAGLWGIRRKIDGKGAVCLLRDRLERLLPKAEHKGVLEIWAAKEGLILRREKDPEHLTQQLKVQGLTPDRPRFLCFRSAALRKIAKQYEGADE